jgi:hypothetical protein
LLLKSIRGYPISNGFFTAYLSLIADKLCFALTMPRDASQHPSDRVPVDQVRTKPGILW